MLPPLENLSLFITAALVLLLTPGPAVLYIVASSVAQGRKAGLASVLGVQAGAMFHVLGATLGLSALLLTSALAYDVVKYLGAAYLIYLGIRTLTARDVGKAVTVERKSLRRLFSQGLVVNLLNPKTALFFFAFLPQFVDTSAGSVTVQTLALGLLFVMLAVCTDGMYALLAGTFSRWLRDSRGFRRFQRYFTGTVYIGLGMTAALAGTGRK